MSTLHLIEGKFEQFSKTSFFVDPRFGRDFKTDLLDALRNGELVERREEM